MSIKKYLYEINKDFGYIYYLVPKVATRSLSLYFQCHNSCRIRTKHGILADTPRHISDVHDLLFTFSFCRNPFSRLVSSYQNKIIEKHEGGLDKYRNLNNFKDFIKIIKNLDLTLFQNDRHIMFQDSLIPSNIDFVGRFESLEEDLKIVCDEIKINKKNSVLHLNKSNYTNYIDYYDDETREIVEKKYSVDLKRFGYKFGDK